MGEKQQSTEAIGPGLLRQPVKAEVKVQVELPPEATALLRDLHNDRQSIGAVGLIMLICTILMTLKSILAKREHA